MSSIGAGLFALSLGALAASSLVVVGALRLGGTATILALWVVATGQIVLLAEALSLLDALDWPGFLAGHLLILAGAAAWARRRPPAERLRAARAIREGLQRALTIASDWQVAALPILAVAVILAGVLSLVLALWVPPNSWDSLSYHLTRVGYYLQFRSLDVYPNDDPRQIRYPANAELLILWPVAFLRSDRLANLPQLLAWAVTAVAVYGLGRRVGLGPRAALFGAGLFALLPQAVLQASSTLNDLVVTSFVAVSLFFLLHASGDGITRQPTPVTHLVLAGAAAGLAVGTKGTALLALPGLAVASLVLFRRGPDRSVLAGLALGGLAAILLGSYFYVQNWLVYAAPAGPGLEHHTAPLRWEAFVGNLARTLYAFVVADFAGPLADPRARPLADWLARALGGAGERLFAALGLPTAAQGILPAWWESPFKLVREPRLHEMYSGVGPVGGLILALALGVLVWPARVPAGRRLLALAALSHLGLTALLVHWVEFAAGRFLLIACALGAPLLGVVVGGRAPPTAGRGRRAAALGLAVWSAATGLYVAWFNETKPIPALAGQDRFGLMMLNHRPLQAFFREVDRELGPGTTVGVYGAIDPGIGIKGTWEYPFFGPRFERTLVPLVASDYAYAGRRGFRRPSPGSNAELVAAYRPTYVAVEGRRPGVEALPDIIPGRCWEVPLEHAKPAVPWELWRCEDRDPRGVLENGDFAAWPGPGAGAPRPTGWQVDVAGEGDPAVRRLDPAARGGEPFRLRLDHRGAGGGGGIVQAVPVDGLRGALLVVDARVRADRPGAALLWVEDDATVTEVDNATADPETLRLEHRVDPRATGLRVGLDAGPGSTVLVRAVLAIPR